MQSEVVGAKQGRMHTQQEEPRTRAGAAEKETSHGDG